MHCGGGDWVQTALTAPSTKQHPTGNYADLSINSGRLPYLCACPPPPHLSALGIELQLP